VKIVAFFIRHGQTDLNKANDFRGDIDIPLNETGQQEAEEIPEYLAAYPLSVLYHSGMQRTEQTLEPLVRDRNMPSIGLENFNGLDTGEFSGKPKTKENKKILDYYRANPKVKIPGGESVEDFRNRVDPIIYNVIKVGEESGKPSVAVVHGSVLREVSRLFHNDYNELKVEPGGIVGIFKSSSGYSAQPLLKESITEEDIAPPGS
jgi:broad specificity phosphatase PhoE